MDGAPRFPARATPVEDAASKNWKGPTTHSDSTSQILFPHSNTSLPNTAQLCSSHQLGDNFLSSGARYVIITLALSIISQKYTHQQTSMNMIADEDVTAAVTLSEEGSSSLPYTTATQSTRIWCTPCRAIVLSGAAIIFVAAASSGVFSFNEENDFSSTFDPFDPMTWKLPDFMDRNPHGGNSPFDFNVWEQSRDCRGLKLRIINNLDDKWEPYFQQSIEDWEQGDPNVLSLSVVKVAQHDPACEFVIGSMKVCNGDYGNTDWVGLNQVKLLDDQIIASVVFMNDYHLDRMSVEAKQSTMCHELGQ
eukprot:scaffold11045_cov138-Skeletonema_menzelii.AAC.6